jgi:hypothetical protein
VLCRRIADLRIDPLADRAENSGARSLIEEEASEGLFTRFAAMIKVFTAGGRGASRPGGSWAGLIALLALSLAAPARAQQPKADPAAPQQKGAEGEGAEAKTKGEGEEDEEVRPPVDPSESQKSAPLEIFLDPNAVAALDVKKFKPIPSPRGTTAADAARAKEDAAKLKQMAGDRLTPPDPRVIAAVVDDAIAKLTNHKYIEANLPDGAKAKPEDVKAIQDATETLLEPIFLARSAENAPFQARYNQILAQKLEPVLKNHLIPRIQAMIILGQSANVDAYKTFLAEIQNPSQTVWVKLWAFRGLTNIKKYSNKLNAQQEIDAAKAVSDLLVKNQDWPWPVQLRGLEALAALRQGFVIKSPKTADMASTAFQYLVNDDLRPEVRAEAAVALAMMQMNANVPKYNLVVAAHATAQLAATIGEKIATGFTENKLYAQKLTTLLMGPITQAFEGRQGQRESGFLNSPLLANKADVQKYLDAIRPMMKAAIDLVGGPPGQAKARNDDLTAKVAAFKDFLKANTPQTTELFQGGPQLPAASDAVAEGAPDDAEAKDQAKADAKAKAAPEKTSATSGARGNP